MLLFLVFFSENLIYSYSLDQQTVQWKQVNNIRNGDLSNICYEIEQT